MARHPRLWLIVASVFTAINVAGAPFAAFNGEPLHATVHVVLALVGAYFVSRLAPRARAGQLLVGQPAEERLDRLQQSLDAIAIEVERIGEAQRFMTKVAADRVESSRPESPNDQP